MAEGHIHRTERGKLVRSKSEALIANKLHARRIDYVYEQPLALAQGRTRYPDFTISDHARGVTYYWEHLMALDDLDYREHCERKRSEYLAAGIRPWQEGGGLNGTLVETQDKPGGGVDAAMINKLIDRVLRN
jgi:hypothetical protein